MSNPARKADTGLMPETAPIPSHGGARLATLSAAVRALDERFVGETMPEPLVAAMRLARTVVTAQAAGVPVTDGELVEAAAALAGALRALRETEVRS
jgi:hypothetical protein